MTSTHASVRCSILVFTDIPSESSHPLRFRIALRGGRPRVTRTIFFNARYWYRTSLTVVQSRLCSNPLLVQITQTQGSRSRSSRSTWTTSFRAFSLGLDVHFSQMAVRQIFSRSLSATALHCEKYDNGLFFSVGYDWSQEYIRQCKFFSVFLVVRPHWFLPIPEKKNTKE